MCFLLSLLRNRPRRQAIGTDGSLSLRDILSSPHIVPERRGKCCQGAGSDGMFGWHVTIVQSVLPYPLTSRARLLHWRTSSFVASLFESLWMKTALVTGVSGQDGSYAAEELLERGYRVVGTVRSVSRARAVLPMTLLHRVELIEWDLLDQGKLVEILRHYQPAEIYNYAAYTSGEGMYDDPLAMAEINGLAVARILEAIREVDRCMRFCQASSAEMFGEASETPQSESTRFLPRSPYGAAKVYAHSMIHIYRQRYGIFGCSAILFNHESPRRSLGFVTRKITHTAAQIKLGLAAELALGNLEARRDWGFAGDVVHAMWMMLQAPVAGDYVVATGETHSVREFCDAAFSYLGLDYRNYVREDPAFFRPLEPVQLVGNALKLNSLGWLPRLNFLQMVGMMVEADMRVLRESGRQETT